MGTVSEKASQESSLFAPKDSRVGELPQLDFHTSLDDLRANGDLDITDRFLHNLKGVA
jgi:hypothetical protein